MRFFIVVTVLSFSGCVSVGYHNRTLREMRDENYKETMRLAIDVRDDRMTIYEMIRRLKDRRFTRGE